ncbi:MAG: hypothetical protein N0E54_05380 [Candidatus Thiodiazotropha taylori]|nr:hypothetical protein [Candidatus Thiodiazotropha endolucinida]MCW4228158.1 hypothetical protein [Candidatus Thiodiazotropha taylori]
MKSNKISDDLYVPVVIEGVVQYRVVIENEDVKEFSSEALAEANMNESQITAQWLNVSAQQLWALPTVQDKRYSKILYQELSDLSFPLDLDAIGMLSISRSLGLLPENELLEIIERLENSRDNVEDILRANERINKYFWIIHYIDYYVGFIDKGRRSRVIDSSEAENAVEKLLSVDVDDTDLKRIRDLVVSVLPKDSFPKIDKLIKNESIIIDNEFVSIHSETSMMTSLRKLAGDNKFIAPGVNSNLRRSARIVDVGTLIQENAPEILIEGLLSITTYPTKPGLGQAISTHSLFPGEKATLTIEKFQKEKSIYSLTSSILDSANLESEMALEDEINSENSFNRQSTRTSSFSAGASVKASWGWGGASAGTKSSSSAKNVMETSVKNIRNAVKKQAATVSKNRSVKVETASKDETEDSRKESIVRTIENINVSAPLNFIFRQLNQEHTSITTLVDIRIVVRNGIADSGTATSLQALPDAIKEVYFDGKEDKNDIVQKYYTQCVEVVKSMTESGLNEDSEDEFILLDSNYDDDSIPRYRVNEKLGGEIELEVGQFPKGDGGKGVFDTHSGISCQKKCLPYQGLLLSVESNVIKTEGVFVECFLSNSKGLDSYSEGLQIEEINHKRRRNELLKTKNKHLGLAKAVVEEAETTDMKAELFERLVVPLWANDVHRSDT